MRLEQAISAFRSEWVGFNAPATAEDLEQLQFSFGPMHKDVLELYRDHNGAEYRKLKGKSDGTPSDFRLMPVKEAMASTQELYDAGFEDAGAGSIVWLWTDDNSNYSGIYTTEALTGWLVYFDHEDQLLTPAWRSISEFLFAALESFGDPDRCGLPPRRLPVRADDTSFVDSDRQLARYFAELYENGADDPKRDLYAHCALTLTPVADMPSVLPFLEIEDIWIPAAAADLMRLRNWPGGIPELEKIAIKGKPNGDVAAIRALLKFQTPEAVQAIERIKARLSPEKLKGLGWLFRKVDKSS